jgi:serine/threonine protein kinase
MLGKIVSHYKILEKIGEGGMGVVYRAHDIKLDREVALKFLPPALTAVDADKTRFIREARAAAALNHPNVCVIYEIEDQSEYPFIAMELIEGVTLRKKLREGALQVGTAIDFALQIAEALGAAHQKDIIHRDIKSENIMVTETGLVKVMDFGLAKIRGAAGITRTSSTLGTVAYMPPEHLQGRKVDARADIFSFGVLLYEMLTGKLPFSGEYESAMIYSILNEEPEPVQKHRPGISSELLHLLSRALEKDPDHRYQSSEDMLIDLKRFKRDIERPVYKADIGKQPGQKHAGGEKDWEAQKTVKLSSESPSSRIPSMIAAILIIAVAAVLYLLIFRSNINDTVSAGMNWKSSIAVLPFEDASPSQDQEYFCDGMTEEVITHLARNPDLKVISRSSTDFFKGSSKSLQVIGRELGVKNILEGSIRKEGDVIRITARLIALENSATLWTDSYDRELENVFGVQEEVAREISGALKLRFVPSDGRGRKMSMEMYEYYMRAVDNMNNYLLSKNEQDFQRAVDAANRGLEIEPDNGLMYALLAWVYNNRYAMTGEQEYREPVIRYCIRSYQLNPGLAEANAGMAYACFTQKQFEKTAHYLKKALKINPNTFSINHIAGIILNRVGLHEQSAKYFERSAALNPFYLFTPLTLAHSRLSLGDLKGAEKTLKKASDLSMTDPDLNRLLAELSIYREEFAQARNYLKRAHESVFGGSSSRAVMAILYAAHGKREEALSIEDIDDWSRGLVYAKLGMKEEAFSLLEAGSESSYIRLINHPFYQPLRGDERYRNVAEKLKERYRQMQSIFSGI